MINKTISNIHSDSDFHSFIEKHFMKPVVIKNLPPGYLERIVPEEELNKLPENIRKNIIERNLIRDNIFYKYKIDIYINPIVVFYENEKGKNLKGFLNESEAISFTKKLLNNGIHSLLLRIMNRDIDCEVIK